MQAFHKTLYFDFYYKPWFAQVTWQMMACDIITIGQQ